MLRWARLARFGERHRGDQLAGGDPRKHVGTLGRIVKGGEQIWRQHRSRQVGSAEQYPAHLLGHHGQFRRPGTRAAEFLGDRQAEKSHPGQLRPHGRVVSGLVGHQSPDLGLR